MDAILFYQIQLAVISFICIVSLFLDRLVARKVHDGKPSSRYSDDIPGADPQRRVSTMSTLAWKYLVVYGIIMSKVLLS